MAHIFQNDPEQLLSLLCACNTDLVRLHEAENVLLFDRLAATFAADGRMAVADTKYAFSYGPDDLRAEIAAFLSRGFALGSASLTAEEVSCFAGTRCALEVSGRVLFADRPERGVLIPAPYWQGFNWIYHDRLGCQLVTVQLTSDDDFALSMAKIRQAYARCQPRPAALVLTNPHNPLGVNYDPELLAEIYDWVLERTEMHIFSDEIYAHCQMEGIGRSTFRSALSLPIAHRHPMRVHVAWGFAKDFGLSGFRVGVFASRNAEFHAATRQAAGAGFSPLTSSNSFFLRKLFAPTGDGATPADDMMRELAPRLRQSFVAVTEALDRRGVPRFEGTHAAQFIFLDLRRYLDRVPGDPCADSKLANVHLLDSLRCDQREKKLHAHLLHEAKVSLLPGQTLSTAEPGFFRLCFTAENEDRVVAAVEKIADALPAVDE